MSRDLARQSFVERNHGISNHVVHTDPLLLLLVVDVVISLVVVEPQDIKVDTTASLTMFTINPLAFARLRPSTLLEFVACSGFSLILC